VFTGSVGKYVALEDTIRINIVSAEGEVYAGEATIVFAPAAGGE
jgi:F0F1-type ATP synthase epsilon subunit